MTPQEHLRFINKQYPNLPKQINAFLNARNPDFPDWCFLPLEAWSAIAHRYYPKPIFNVTAEVSKLSALATWQYTQGIYRFDPKLFECLAIDRFFGVFPTESFYHLPEWCIYVDTLKLGASLSGFWAHLEYDIKLARHELRLLVNRGDTMLPIILHIGDWTIAQAINKIITENKEYRCCPEAASATAEFTYPLVSLLIYIIQNKSAITNNQAAGSLTGMRRACVGQQPAIESRVWTIDMPTGS